MVSALRGQIKLDPRQHLSPLEALFKISDEHACHFHRGIPLPWASNRLLKGPVIKSINYLPKFSLTWPIFFKAWVLLPQVQILSAIGFEHIPSELRVPNPFEWWLWSELIRTEILLITFSNVQTKRKLKMFS